MLFSSPSGGIARRGTLRGVCAAAAASAAVAGLVAAAAGGGTAVASSRPHTASAPCGTVPKVPLPQSTGNLLASLPANVRSLYTGFDAPVLKSAWANWRPKPGKLVIGVSFSAVDNPFTAALYPLVQKELKSTPGVSKVIAYAATSPTDVTGQIQQYQSLVQHHVNLIVLLGSEAFLPVIKQAAKAGIPTVSIVNDVPSNDTVNISPNTWEDNAGPVTRILNLIGQKGNVLLVHGIPGTQSDTDTINQYNQLIAACPNVTNLGAIVGEYAPPVVASAVLQFLATHPQPISAVFQVGTMAPSIIQAFQQAGRPVPAVEDEGAQAGSLAYWSQNKSTYNTAGSVGGVAGLANETVRVVRRMLVGQGVKVNNFVWIQPIVTAANLSSYVQPSWTPATPGAAENPPSTWISNSQLNSLFNHPTIKVTNPS